MGNDSVERVSEGVLLAEYWVKNELSPKDTEHLKEKGIHLSEKYGHMFPRKGPAPFISFIVGAGIPVPYTFGGKEKEGPTTLELQNMLLRDLLREKGYNR